MTSPSSPARTIQRPLRIGDVAAASGVSVDALRFYERRGLLRPAGRRASGYREYTADTIALVRFIRRAQSLGFSLAEVEELVRLRERAWVGRAPERLRDAAVEKMHDIDRRLRELGQLRAALGSLVAACDQACEGSAARGSMSLHCPLVEAFEDDPASGIADNTTPATIAPPAPGRAARKSKRIPANSPRSRRNTP